MLIETLIRKTLNVKSHKVVKVIQTCGGIEVYMDRSKRRRLPCGQCGTLARVRDRLKPRHLNKAVDEVRREEAKELKKSNPELLNTTARYKLK